MQSADGAYRWLEQRWGRSLVHNRQTHSGRVVPAQAGRVQEADGLWSDRSDLGLVVVTADCLPILLTDGSRTAAVHAGWRGLVAGIIGEACERLRGESASWTAWIGPAIGPCCYEVGDDVAVRVAATADGSVILPPPTPRGRRPHLDLPRGARIQLERQGVREIRELRRCTCCGDGERWWSYRRQGSGAGRNLAVIGRR